MDMFRRSLTPSTENHKAEASEAVREHQQGTERTKESRPLYICHLFPRWYFSRVLIFFLGGGGPATASWRSPLTKRRWRNLSESRIRAVQYYH